jgi:hypothetical protein
LNAFNFGADGSFFDDRIPAAAQAARMAQASSDRQSSKEGSVVFRSSLG